MTATLKWLGWAALALLVLAAAAAAGGYLWLRGSLPEIDGERAIRGLAAPVEVVRDRHGIPHILARSEEDALFALGYVHAQDRLWQMEMNRRIGAGRLAEVLGAPALDTDRLLRVLGLYRRAEAGLAHLSPGARRRIDAYANGVNAWLETRTGPLPPEFLILGFEPGSLDGGRHDGVAQGDGPRPRARMDPRPHAASHVGLPRPGTNPRLLHALPRGQAPRRRASFAALDRGGERPGNAARTSRPGAGPGRRLASRWRTDRPGDRVAGGPARGPSWVLARSPEAVRRREADADTGRPDASVDRAFARASKTSALYPTRGASIAGTSPASPPPSTARAPFRLGSASSHPGSNSWAVSGERSETGKPLLANDPHLGLTVPSVWYFAHLSWPGRDVVGATFPGMPVVVLGHNGRAAWGFTNTGADTQDLFLEKLDPGDPARYLTPDGYRRFEVHREVIRVKGDDDVVLPVRESRHGPILDDASAGAALASPSGHVLALGWTALRDDDLTLEAGLGLPAATSWPRFVENFRNFHSPPQNVSYADVEGNIGFLVPGRIPIRPGPGPDGVRPGTLPRPGWNGEHDWRGFVPFEALPRVYNPPGGAVVTANHAVTAEDYPHPLTFEWAAGFRAARIMERLAARPRHDAGSFRSLQQDRVSTFARALLPRLRDVPLGADATPLARRARGLLETWDGEMNPDRPEPLVFHAWIWEFARLATADELGSVQEEAWVRKGAFVQRILETREVWCDDLGTERTETCDDILVRALERAVGRVAERRGDDPVAWRWGEEHVALAEHRPLASSPLAPLFNLRGPAPGSLYAVNAFEFSPLDQERPFASTHGPSMRAIYDLADLERSLFIHSTGQSGNVLSPLYDSFEEPWRNGQYVTIPTRREAFEEGALGRLRLVPH